MSRIQELRDMTPAEVARIHRVFDALGGDEEKVIEALTDLRAYCGRAWPKMLEEALKRYNRDRRGGE
jgi:hypothetical protein